MKVLSCRLPARFNVRLGRSGDVVERLGRGAVAMPMPYSCEATLLYDLFSFPS